MAKSELDRDVLRVLYSEADISARVKELGEAIYAEFQGKNPLFVGVLKGCFLFLSDLIRACPLKSELAFIAVSSYGDGTASSGNVQITRDLGCDVTGRDLIVVEDILDSGNTLDFLTRYFQAKGAASVTIVTLLDKPERREKPVVARYVGFRAPNEFVVGYGLDYKQQYRNLPYVGVLKPEAYAE